jgi:hypothetical protein
MHCTLEPAAAFQQKLSVQPPIPIIHEDRFSVITALYMVNGDTWKENARDARHIRTLTNNERMGIVSAHATSVVSQLRSEAPIFRRWRRSPSPKHVEWPQNIAGVQRL